MKAKNYYAEIHDIQEDVIDHKTNKKYDTGVCSHCGFRTKIAQERSIGGVFGKSEKHFCDNCGVFLRSNPFHSIFFGLAQGTFFLILFLVIAANMKTPASTARNVFFLILFLGMIDGIRRSFAGIQGVIGKKKNPSDTLLSSQLVLYQDAIESCKRNIDSCKYTIRIKPDYADGTL